MKANIYHVFNGWRVQFGYTVIGTYATLKGARIGCKKKGYTYYTTEGKAE